ncbi:Sorting nexin 2B [Morella rubra]|uniref:Sorting nexin 2B n=1 Tax=Morella rubra TaxID=262757 RepID=A0A6A1UR05_9ROSI|nr:Sorting nexin 2B [Morella rubra]
MMGSQNEGFEEAQLFASKEEMENLMLDDPLNGSKSYSNHRSAFSSSMISETHHPFSPSMISETHHPFSPSIRATPADTDPLLSPPPYRDLRNPNAEPESSYIEPPSYTDVIFSPFDGDNVGDVNGVESPSRNSDNSGRFSRSPSSSTSSPSWSSENIKITVSNPQKEQEASNSLVPGGGVYVTYLITTRTNLQEFEGSEFSVRRRFRDVVTLADRLAESYRGIFIPPRPDKSVVESQVMQKQEFVEQRRVALEKYLRRLAAHPVIKRSDELKVFLKVQGKLPLPTTTDVASRMLDGAVKLPKQLLGESSMVVAPHEVVQPAKGGRDLLRLFKELKQSMANDWGGSRPPVAEEDKEFLEKKEKINDLEQQLSNASQQAESLVKAQQDMGETMGELGLAFIKLTKFENEEAMFNSQRVRANDMKGFATAAVKASRFQRELNAQTVKHLDTLHEYLGLMLAVHTAFSDRTSALLTVQTLLSELSLLQSRAEKLEAASSKVFGGDRSRIRKLEDLKETIRATEDAKNVAIKEYERIKMLSIGRSWLVRGKKENNRTELERLDTERKADLLNMVRGFVLNQVNESSSSVQWDD